MHEPSKKYLILHKGDPAARWCEESTCSRGIRCPGVHVVERPLGYREGTYTTRVGGKAEWLIASRYVTGRGGRVSTRELFLCPTCAERMAKRQGFDLPPSPEAKVVVGVRGGDTMLVPASLARARTP